MSADSLKLQIQSDMKTAMKAQESRRLGVIRLLLAAIKQREVDERIVLDDLQILAVIEKMLKQRQDSVNQFQNAGRHDLVEQEQFEMEVLQSYLPPALSTTEVSEVISSAIAQLGAQGLRDMGKVMAEIKPKLQGRADMTIVSQLVKQQLGV